MAYSKSKFEKISLITNAYWATGDNAALLKLEPLKDAGLNIFIVSTSPFHTRYIDPKRVHIAVAAAEKLGLKTYVKVTSPNAGQRVADLLTAIGPLPPDVEIDEMKFLPGGRASMLPLSHFETRPGIPEGRCPGAIVTIHPNGDAYYCCTPGAKTDTLKLGNALSQSIESLVRQYYTGGMFAFLREVGPSGFMPAIERCGVRKALPDEHVDVCHLCSSILKNPATSHVAVDVASSYERDIYSSIAAKVVASLANKKSSDANRAV